MKKMNFKKLIAETISASNEPLKIKENKASGKQMMLQFFSKYYKYTPNK